MTENNENGGFRYTYSAREQAELRRIREKYAPPAEKENKLERLRRLDGGVTRKAMVLALTLGVIGTLVLGLGMSLIMTELSATLGLTPTVAVAVGVTVGVVGGITAALAYPLYHATLKRERARVAPEILRLTDELLK